MNDMERHSLDAAVQMCLGCSEEGDAPIAVIALPWCSTPVQVGPEQHNWGNPLNQA